MPSRIFLLGESSNLVPMDESPYESEALLQELIAEYPDLLAGDQINNESPRKWLLISQEMSVPGDEDGAGRFSLDHLFLDQDGIPTLIEVKRSTDTRIRREVVGQMLDYAANAVAYWPVDRIKAAFESRCEKSKKSSQKVMLDFLGLNMTEADFWQRTKSNLDGKNVRLVFVSDHLPPELIRIIEFLNEQMNPAEVLGIEVKQFAAKGMRTLVPRVVGLSESSKSKKSATKPSGHWDEPSFFEHITTQKGTEVAEVARKILEWANAKQLRVWWGKGSKAGSFMPIYDSPSGPRYTVSVWSSGSIELQFQHMKYPPYDDLKKRWDLAQRIMETTGLTLSENAMTKRPSFPFEVLLKDNALTRFLTVFDSVIDELKPI